MDKRLTIYVIMALLLIVLVVIVVSYFKDDTGTFNNMSSTTVITEVDVEQEDKRGEEIYTNYNAQIDLSNLTVEGSGVSIEKNVITISKAGTYYFSGTLEDGNIVVNAGDDDNVILVFDNANITSSTTACINGINAKNIYINLVEGSTNTFTDSSNYTVFTEDDEPNGTIFSKTDLLINGKGKLVVNANYLDGIVSKDDLVITNATIEVNSNDDAIRGKDSVDIKDSIITISSKGDGIKSNNDTDEGKGYVIIESSTITINSGDDAIHAENELVINSGTINIEESHEGLEGLAIQINGGDIKIKADDDGINAAGSNGALLEINGGNIYVDSSGDGLDANGSIKMTGGIVTVAGTQDMGNGAIDYDNEFNISGGNLVVYSGTGMWLNTSTTSSQYAICFSAQGNSGDKIEILDSDGNVIERFVTDKSYSAILISNNKIKNGETYTLNINGTEKSSLEVTSVVSSQVQENGFMGGMGPGGNQGDMRRGNMPDMNSENMPQMQDGQRPEFINKDN